MNDYAFLATFNILHVQSPQIWKITNLFASTFLGFQQLFRVY